jgi:hypothetical protein
MGSDPTRNGPAAHEVGPAVKQRLARAALALLLLPAALPGRSLAQDVAFQLIEIANRGRTTGAEIADLDGDGLGDLLCIVFSGLPPEERRDLAVRFQRADGSLPAQPDWSAEVPPGAAVFDLADVDPSPGTELLFLHRERIGVLSLAGRRAARHSLALPAPSLGLASDERGLDRVRLVRDDLGPQPRLLVPLLGAYLVLSTAGELLGQPAAGGRANYFVPQSGPLLSESELELYFDAPRMHAGDVDGDGRVDLIASSRHEVRVFRQGEDGRFPGEADRVIPLRLLSEADHIRSSGQVRVATADFDADGLADLLVSQSGGGILDAESRAALHMNRAGTWNLHAPDQVFQVKGGMLTHQILDLDGDGRVELIDVRLPLNVLTLMNVLVTRDVEARVAIYRAGSGVPFAPRPWFERTLSVSFDFRTLRARGFIPTVEQDLNGDGHRDLLSSADGEAVEVTLGGPGGLARLRSARQPLDTAGRLRFGDFDADGLPDFVLYDSRRPEVPVRLLVNRGALPGTPPSPPALRAAEAAAQP